MKIHYSISIPKPCHEDWSQMSPNEKGRFCQSCSKTVVDFTTMQKEKIEDYLALNSENKICGRFRVTQLEQIQIKIPQQLIEEQTSFHKLFLLTLLIAMGTTLFNCSDQNGNTKKIETVEVIDSTTNNSKPLLKTSTIPEVKSDSSKCKTVPKKQDSVNVIEIQTPIVTGEIIDVLGAIAIEPPETEYVPNDEEIIGFIVVNQPPEFKDTPKNLTNAEKRAYMSNKINEIVTANFNTGIGKTLELEGKQRVRVQFTIDKNGTVSNIKTRATHPQLEEEAKRVINLLPQFIPGQQRGINVGVSYSLPIVFMVED
tara:strand:- start:13880 stop:14818 length:939 start_codon:yes stop_codon:yes gene_type:complete